MTQDEKTKIEAVLDVGLKTVYVPKYLCKTYTTLYD